MNTEQRIWGKVLKNQVNQIEMFTWLSYVLISVETKEADSTNDPELDETICYEINFSDSNSDDSDCGPSFPNDSSDREDEVNFKLLAI